NLTGGFLMAREAYTQHMGAHGGVIVNLVADMWRGMPGMGHSGASRAGMVNFTKTAAVEWASSGVRVNAVAPGFIASSGMDTYPDSIKAHLAELPRAVPLKRMGTEEEVSAAIVYLLSPAAAYVTGQTLSVDGGSPLYPTLPLLSIPEHGNSTPYRGFHRGAPPELSATPEESD
ncbi:MAG: SDR family oxidoreductase, partial [Myxococcota bacterium]